MTLQQAGQRAQHTTNELLGPVLLADPRMCTMFSATLEERVAKCCWDVIEKSRSDRSCKCSLRPVPIYPTFHLKRRRPVPALIMIKVVC